MKRYQAYFIDLDGTMYKGKERIETAEQFVKDLQDKGIPYVFLTNNSTKTPDEVVSYLKELCQLHISPNEVYTSGMASVDYLKTHYPEAKVLLIGEVALKHQLEEAGFELTHHDPDVVLQALDRSLTYQKLEEATLAIRKGAKFIVTNADLNLPNEKGLTPGSGAITALLKAATGIEPLIIGKPNALIMEQAIDYLNSSTHKPTIFSKKEIVMVGDNYDTDILAGIHSDMDTLLVLTGVSSRNSIKNYSLLPTHIVNDLSEWRLGHEN